MPGKRSLNWTYIFSRKERWGSCGQVGMSRVSRTSRQATSGSVWGKLPPPTVHRERLTLSTYHSPQTCRERRMGDAVFGDDAGHVAVGCHVKGQVQHPHAVWRYLAAVHVG